jgi:hypothetical protein
VARLGGQPRKECLRRPSLLVTAKACGGTLSGGIDLELNFHKHVYSSEETTNMKRAMTWMTALIVVIAGFAVMGDSQASAGLFDRNKCKPAKCKKVRRSRRSQRCQTVSSCSTPCEEAAPCGCETTAAAPCGCPEATADCGCETKCQTCCTRRQVRKSKRSGCCAQQCSTSSSCSTCGDAAAPAGGAEQAPDLPEDATT